MKHIRLRLTPREGTIHPLFSMLTSRPFISSAQMVDWNLTDIEEPALLFAIEGDRSSVVEELDGMPSVRDYEATSIDRGRFYLHVWPVTTGSVQALFEMQQREDVVIVHPVVYRDGSAYVSILGKPGNLQAAVDEFARGLEVSVEQVGDFHASPETLVSRLSPRQREALEAAVELGYYGHPRRATHEDIARRLGCAPNTASVHLQKAEAKIITAVMR